MHNWYKVLSAIDTSDVVKEKNGQKYIPWMWSWIKLKTHYPLSRKRIYEREDGSQIFPDPQGGHVKTSVTIVWEEEDGIHEHEEIDTLPCMDYKNKSIQSDSIDSMQVNKATRRCLAKCMAELGLGANVFVGEDVPESVSKMESLKEEIDELARKKAKQSDKAKGAVAELCKKAEKEANPELEDSLITGNYNNINDNDILEKLKKNLMAVRK